MYFVIRYRFSYLIVQLYDTNISPRCRFSILFRLFVALILKLTFITYGKGSPRCGSPDNKFLMQDTISIAREKSTKALRSLANNNQTSLKNPIY